MPQASIIINQSGKPAGSAGVSRDDLDLSTSVTLSNDNVGGETTYLWVLLSKPVGSSATLATPTTSTSSFTPDVIGSYLLHLTVNGSLTDSRIAAVKTANLQIRTPATGEEDEFDATDGWGEAFQDMVGILDAAAPATPLSVYSTFSDAIDDIGSSEEVLLINRDETLTADKTVPLNVTLKFIRDSVLTINSGVTLTVNGLVDAGLYQIFNVGPGGVANINIGDIHPEWWGAVGDGTTDDYDIFWDIKTAAAVNGNRIRLQKDYKLETGFTIAKNVPVIFEPGSTIVTDTGVDITFDGEIEAGSHQIFDLTAGGHILLGSTASTNQGLSKLNAMWYGADPSQASDATPALSEMVYTANNSVHDGIELFVPKGSYLLSTGGVTITADNVRWVNDPGTILNMQQADGYAVLFSFCNGGEFAFGEIKSSPRVSNSNGPTVGLGLEQTRNVKIRNAKFHLLDQGVLISEQAFYNSFDTCWINNCSWADGYGGHVKITGGSNDNRFYNVRFAGDSDIGLLIEGTSTSLRTSANLFSGCSFETVNGEASIWLADWAFNNTFLNCRIESATNTVSVRLEENTGSNSFINSQHAEPLNDNRSDGENWTIGGISNVFAPNAPNAISHIRNGGFSMWTSSSIPDEWTLSSGSATIAEETSTVRRGSSSLSVSKTSGDAVTISQSVPTADLNFLIGKSISFGCWVRADTSDGYTNDVIIRTDDGASTIQSAAVQASNTWTWLGRSRELSDSATEVTVELILASSYPQGRTVYFSDVVLMQGTSSQDIGPKLLQDSGGAIYGDLDIKGNLTYPNVDSVGLYTDLNAAITAIGATETKLIINENTTVSSNLTVPANVTLESLHGNLISVGGGITLDSYGPIVSNTQIFTGSGDIIVQPSANPVIYSYWWGFDPSETAVNNATILNQIVTNMAPGSELIITRGSYSLDSTTVQSFGIGAIQPIFDGITISGEGKHNTILTMTGSTVCTFFYTSNLDKITIRDLQLVGNNSFAGFAFAGGNAIVYSAGSSTTISDVSVENCKFREFGGSGWIWFASAFGNSQILRPRVTGCEFSDGYDRDPTDGGVRAEQILFQGTLDAYEENIKEAVVMDNIMDAYRVKTGISCLWGMVDAKIVNNTILNAGQLSSDNVVNAYGIALYGSARRCILNNNRIVDGYSSCIYIVGARDIVVSGNYIEGQTDKNDATLQRAGIAMACDRFTITGNTIKDCLYSISVQNSTTDPISGGTVTGNYISMPGSNTPMGIILRAGTLNSTRDITVTGNVVVATTIGDGRGIRVTRGTSKDFLRINISNNVVKGAQFGIDCSPSGTDSLVDSVISNNMLSPSDWGIFSEDCIKRSVISGNIVTGDLVSSAYHIIDSYGCAISNNHAIGLDSGFAVYDFRDGYSYLWNNTAYDSSATLFHSSGSTEDLAVEKPTFTTGVSTGAIIQRADPGADGYIGWVFNGTDWDDWGPVG